MADSDRYLSGRAVKLFITGISGLLGLNLALKAREEFEVSGACYQHSVALKGVPVWPLDLRSLQATETLLRRVRPDVVVHTAGLTNVEECETNPELAHQLNVVAARNVAAVAAGLGISLVHISTDHLFDGSRPWQEETDVPMPLNNYARTKWQGEQAVLEVNPAALVIRTNFYGWGTSARSSFSDWILRGLERRQELTMFTDVYFTPILIHDLADRMMALVRQGASGEFNVAGGERLSKYAFALQIAQVFGYPSEQIRPISVDEFVFNARRPKDMSLSSAKAEKRLGMPMPTAAQGLVGLRRLQQTRWPQALEEAISSKVLHPAPDA